MLAVARTKSRELFTLMVFAICSGIAMLASLLGLSIALGPSPPGFSSAAPTTATASSVKCSPSRTFS